MVLPRALSCIDLRHEDQAVGYLDVTCASGKGAVFLTQ
jgi:hypothetical protein